MLLPNTIAPGQAMQLAPLATVTILRTGVCVDGTPFIVCAGLCGCLRMYTQLFEQWALALDVSTAFRLNLGRFSSHPFKCVVTLPDDHRFAASSTDPSIHGAVTVYLAKAHGTVEELKVLRPSDIVDERFSISCMDMGTRHVAAGSREGSIVLWQMDEHFNVDLSWSARTDEGPVAALAVAGGTADVIVAAYRQPNGSVDGAPFQQGEQSVAAWRLSTGALLWRQCPARDQLPPGVELGELPRPCRAACELTHAQRGPGPGSAMDVPGATAPPSPSY